MPLIGSNTGQGIQPDRVFTVSRIKVDEVVCSRRRDMVEQILGEVAMRIDQSDTIPCGDMLKDQIPEESAFA